MKIVRNSKSPTIEELDKRLEEAQLKLIQAANQHQNCNDLTQQVMELREQKEKVQEIESENQVKLHNIDQVSDFVDEHQHGLQESTAASSPANRKNHHLSTLYGVHVQRW